MKYLVLLVASFFGELGTWPSFLGIGHTKVESSRIPVQWHHDLLGGWSQQLPGKGQSSPVIWNERVFVTSISGSMKDECHITAMSLRDGSIGWSKSFPSSQTVRSNYFQSRSAPTPVVDADRIYAFFETGILVGLSHEGEIKWQRSLSDDYGIFESTIGLASSPIQVDDMLVLLIDHEGASYLIGIEKSTGETRWKSDRDSRVSYATPALIDVGNERHVVCSSAGSVDGYDPATGRLLWSYEDVGGNSQNTPVQISDGRILIGAAPGMHNEKEAAASKSNLCMQIVKTDNRYEPRVVWQTEKVMTTFASPMVHQGYAYWVTKAGVVYCYDAETGEQQYSKRLKQPCWVTPIGMGDNVYFFGKDGVTSVLSSGPEFHLVAENQLWDVDLSPPASPGGTRSVSHEHGKDDSINESKTSGGPPERDRTAQAREQGENRFADPIQYGVAISNFGIVIRTGDKVYCVRKTDE